MALSSDKVAELKQIIHNYLSQVWLRGVVVCYCSLMIVSSVHCGHFSQTEQEFAYDNVYDEMCWAVMSCVGLSLSFHDVPCNHAVTPFFNKRPACCYTQWEWCSHHVCICQ